MNNARRKQLNALYSKMEELKSQLETILEEEQESFDNMPESLQDSERGQLSQEAIDNLESAVSSFEEVMEYIENSQQ